MTPLIARTVLFGNPDKASPDISPDGRLLGFLAPVDGVLNVWVGPVGNAAAAKPVTNDKNRGVRMFFWAFTNRHVLYIQDKEGDENWRVYCVDLDGGEVGDLTPFDGVQARIEAVSYKYPEEILIALNDRQAELHDLHRVNIVSGERQLIQENPGFSDFVTDDEYRVRFGSQMTPEGGMVMFQAGGEEGWTPCIKVDMEDTLTTAPSGFDKSGNVLYLIDSRERNTAALTTLDLNAGKQVLVGEDSRADIGSIMCHPTEKTIQAASFTYERTRHIYYDAAVEADFKKLEDETEGDIELLSRTLDDKIWIVAFVQDDGPVRYYRYDRTTKEATFLFTNRVELEGLPLVKMQPKTITSRDGMALVNYLSLPADTPVDAQGRPEAPVPMVLMVHGGPWARATWGYDPMHQWLANRGYAVLDVNFRGSTGFGKDFINAANLEWGGKMHDDLMDAVQWAIDEKIAASDRIAIMGGSYGGYATLAGMTFTPDVFACGVDIVGPSNLQTLIESVPPYWQPMIEVFAKRVGDHRTEEGKALLQDRSPLNHVDEIERPLLIGQGANDPRVKQSESDQIVAAMDAKNIPVTYVLYSDEGHGFVRPENSLSFYAVAEAFLAQHLGGRIEGIGDDFEGSSITVPHGAEQVQGLTQGMDAMAISA